MIGKKILIKSLSTKNMSEKYSLNATTARSSEIKLTPLRQKNLDESVLQVWNEVKAKNSPKRRTYHTSCIYKGNLFIFCGRDITEGKLNDIHKIDLTSNFFSWERVTLTKGQLQPIAHHSGNLVDHTYYMIGGQDECIRQTNKVYVINLETLQIEQVIEDNSFPETELHTSNYIQSKNTIVIFGGFSKGEFLNTMYFFNLPNKTFEKVKYNSKAVPSKRANHSAVTVNDSLYVFGGSMKDGILLNDFWKFDIKSCQWSLLPYSEDNYPNPRSGHNLCVIGEEIFLFGGKVGMLCEVNDLWKYSLQTNKFTIIHDTLLEQFSPSEIEEIKIVESNEGTYKKPFMLLSKKQAEDRKNPFSKSYVGRKNLLPKKLQRSQSTISMRSKYESQIFAIEGFHLMKHSTIYCLDDQGVNQAIQDLKNLYKQKLGKNNEQLLPGHLPLPRDGFAMNVKDKKIYIFGGDRNKFPFNDLFFFDYA